MLRIRPLVGVRALHSKCGGAWRAWAVAFNLSDGSGVVRSGDLEQYSLALGATHRRWRRWLAEAEKAGFLFRIDRRRDNSRERVFRLLSQEKVAQAVGCTRFIGYPAEIRADLFLNQGSAAFIWAAYLTTLPTGIPITRAWMRERTGVPEITQRRYENELQITVTANYAVTDVSPDHLDMVVEYDKPNAFVFYDRMRRRRVVAYRLGNSRVVRQDGVASLKRGRTKRLNAKLRALCGEMDTERAAVRAYHQSEREVEAAMRRIVRLDVRGEVYRRPEVLHSRRQDVRLHRTTLWAVHRV